MADPFVAEIRIFPFNFAPKGWAWCDGQLLPLSQNTALFSLLGTTYGGNGQTTFALPDLRNCVPIHVGSGHTLGERAGEQAHTLSISEMPTHLHTVQGSSSDGDTNLPSGSVLATAANVYGPPGVQNTLQPATISSVGGSQAHLNMQPFLVLTFCIALQGIFPSQN